MGDEGGLGRLGSGGTGVRTDFNRSAGVGLGARQLFVRTPDTVFYCFVSDG